MLEVRRIIYTGTHRTVHTEASHFAKMYRSKIPPLPQRRNPSRGGYQRHQGTTQSQLWVRQIQENLLEEGPNDQIEEESMDPESALYIRDVTEDWADLNHIIPSTFNPIKNSSLNKTHPEEIWIETRKTNNQAVHWLADTGSPRSFLTPEKAKEILKENPKIALQPYKSKTQYRCFNNNNIKVEGTLQLTLQSGSWTARHRPVLVVRHKTNNLKGRDILQKLGIALQQRPKQYPGNNINSISHIEIEKISSSGYLENTHTFARESANLKTTSLNRFSNKITPPTNKKEEGYHYTYSKK